MDNNYIKSIRYNGNIDDDNYLLDLPIVKYLEENRELKFSKNVTIIMGENGAGKSTLIEAIAVASGFNAEGGSKNFNFSTSNTHSNLSDYITIIKNKYPKSGYFLRSESFYNVASNIDKLDSDGGARKIINSYGGVSMHKMSHGESFLALVNNRFSGNSLFILDEPEAALSPTRLMSLIIRIHELVSENSQFIIATHSPILMSYPDALVLQISEDGIESVDYRDTEHFIVTSQFLNNPKRMLDQLLL